MMNDDDRYKKLASKWLDRTITPSEMEEFSTWYNNGQDDQIRIPDFIATSEEKHRQRILNEINRKIDGVSIRQRRINFVKRFAVAASILVFVSIGIYFIIDNRQESTQPQLTNQDIAPGRNRAILTLADGKTISLEAQVKGEVTSELGVTIRQTTSGQIQYEAVVSPQGNPEKVQYNTVATPNGGQYQLVLTDGTKVWLNAASTIVYPTVFAKHERRVKLIGEAYFEVAQRVRGKGSMPFIVETNGQEIKVLGTCFNVNAYEDEGDIKTTLVAGSVRIERKGNNQSVILKPGQQLRVSSAVQNIELVDVDPADYTAWQSNYFYFKDTDIYTIMRQFARWYDIEVHFETAVYTDLYVGKIPRSATLLEALKVLKTVGVKFKNDGRNLYILP